MRTITPRDADYDDARELFNQAIDKRPAVIAQCENAEDIADALTHARDNGYDVAVRSGGHSVSGLSTNDGGLVIDVRPMNSVEVDPNRRSIRVGGGVNWGAFDAATAEHGLAVTGGRATSTGVAGYTLGGGDGWLSRAFGLACDNLISVTVATADGRVVRASETEHPELFWALHGGGGNFGVATEFEFELHPLPDNIYAGLAAWPFDPHASDVATAYRDFMVDAPDEVGTALAVVTGPPEDFVPQHLVGKPLVGLAVCYAGSADEGAAVMKPLMDLAPELNLVGPMPYTEFQIMLTDPPGFHHYWSADYHDDFNDDAMQIFLDGGANRVSPMTQQFLLRWGGAVSRVSDTDTPMAKRSSAWVTHPFGVWQQPSEADANIAWVKQFRRDIAPHSNGGVYLNFVGGEGQERLRSAFGDTNYRRLAAVKGEYDPDNVFRGNQNIQPA
jgi:FAD/FMN-containing dehydrogenase